MGASLSNQLSLVAIKKLRRIMGASYGKCLKAQAHMDGKVDGCQEFKASSLIYDDCSVCGCHKNYHKKVVQQVTQVVYTECHKNHYLNGSYAKDGCKEFRKKSDNFPNICDVCNCDKSFHHNEVTIWK